MARYIGRMARRWNSLDQKVRVGLTEACSETAEITRQKFQTATLKWKNKPKWIKKQPAARDKSKITYQIIALGSEKVLKIFGYVDKGTPPHNIFPKKPGGVLIFNVGYSAKTAPIANANVGSGVASGDKVVTRHVKHPGNEGREFSGFYALEAEEILKRKVIEVFKRYSRRKI